MKKLIIILIVLIFLTGCNFNLFNKQITQYEVEKFVVPQESERIYEQQGFIIVDMIARQWEYVPNEIVLEKGDKVKMQVESVDILHSIYIPDLNIDVKLKPNEKNLIEFEANKTGVFEFFSTSYSGVGFKDMRGKIIVVDRKD